MTLEHPPVVRRKDLGVSEPVTLEPELARRDSRRQIETLLAAFALFCAGEGVLLGLMIGHPFVGTATGLAYAVLYFFVARELGDAWIVRAVRASHEPGPRVFRLAASEARTAQIPVPRVLVSPGAEPNALAFALRRRWLVTTEGSETLDELALEGMLAHETVHLRDGGASVASLYVVLAGGPGLALRRAGVFALLSIPLWPAALALRFLRGVALRDDRQHRADIAAAMLTRYPPGVIAALEVARGRSSGLRLLDPFWFVGRDARGPQDASSRAALVAEM
jgi:Zn-dependent protease with chaperone function